MKTNIIIPVVLFALLFTGCKGKEQLCKSAETEDIPFIEKYYVFMCGGNTYEYQYVKRKQSQIDSLSDCSFTPPLAFPVDETGFVYIMLGKMSYYYKDTFQTKVSLDTCARKVTYEVDMIQRTNTLESNGGGVKSLFCAVENIPADYEVEVKYKYVPIQ